MGKNQNSYTEEFRKKIVQLLESGKSIGELSREYGLSKSTIHTWQSRYQKTGSFKMSGNESEVEKQLKIALKENKQLRMENDILKQAALIFAQREK